MRLPEKGSAVYNMGKVALWVAVSAVVTFFFSDITNRPELYNPATVAFVNVFGKLIVDFLNSEKPNY